MRSMLKKIICMKSTRYEYEGVCVSFITHMQATKRRGRNKMVVEGVRVTGQRACNSGMVCIDSKLEREEGRQDNWSGYYRKYVWADNEDREMMGLRMIQVVSKIMSETTCEMQ